MAQSSVPNPEEEEKEKEKEAAFLPKKDLPDGPSIIQYSSDQITACGTLNPPNSQHYSPLSSSSSSSSSSSNIIRRPNEEDGGNDETPPVQQRLQDRRRQQGGIGIPRCIMNSNVVIPKSEVKLGSLGEGIDGDDQDGMKTPTSPGSKIPSIISCPPAPRKPVSRAIHTKRKLAARRVLFEEYSDEIQSLFSANLASAGKIKKVRLPQP